MEDHREEATDKGFSDKSDICQQLLDRYGKSSAPQHRHLIATAAATKSIIESESLPLTPLSYFAATIDAIFDTSKTLDNNAVSALSAFLSIVLPLVPEKAIAPAKAAYAVGVMAEMLERSSEAVSVRAVVKCIGVLVGFCDLEDWGSVKLGFETLLNFSIDKRPKVRKGAQDCVVKVFKSLESPTVIKKASKMVFSLFRSYMPLAVKLTASKLAKGSKDDILSKPEHLEVLHMLNVLKHFVPYLFVKVNLKVLSVLQTLMSAKFSALTRHIFDVIEATFEAMGAEVLVAEAENIIKYLVSYISSKGNPVDTVLFAATLLKGALNILCAGEPIKWTNHLSLVVGSVAGLLTIDASTASQASNIIEELINNHMDKGNLSTFENPLVADDASCRMESSAVESTCAVFINLLNVRDGIPNEHILAVTSVLFRKLGEISYFYMKGILLKLAELMTLASKDNSDTKNLQECIGSAITAMGPEKLLVLLPISLNEENLDCSNVWLLPILKKYVVGSSLGFFMEHVVPLAESFERACREAKKSVVGEDLQAHARSCWGLLPIFCRHPTDTNKNFGSLAKLLIPLLKRDSFMLENISIALQELVNQNRSVLGPDIGAGDFATLPKTDELGDSTIKLESKPTYSKKVANRNVRALASCSEELLRVLRDVLFESHYEKHSYLKDAIGCLASITDSSVISNFFISSLERFRLINDLGESGNMEIVTDSSVDKDESNSDSSGKETKRFLILELASSIVDGASEDLVDQIFNFIRHTLQETDEIGQREAYLTLNKILKKHTSFCSSKFIEVMDLLLDLKSPVDITSLRGRFTCFQTLLVHAIESLDQENTKAFLILNEIILTLKDSNEEGRKVACNVLLGIGSTLRTSSSATTDGPYHKLISMITGYLSGSSPHIKSGAVSALSILVHNDSNICLLVPDLVPTVLELLESKAIEVIKAVLGFLKVLVLSSQVKDLQKYLTEIVNRVLPWSSISRNHFREKVTVILEILMRKCGSATIKSIASEKYKSFVKDVLENRHGKSSSKEDVSTEIEPKPSDSSSRRQSGISSKENDTMRPAKRKREDKPRGFTRDPDMMGPTKKKIEDKPRGFARGPHSSAGMRNRLNLGKGKNYVHDKPTEGQSPGIGKNKRKNREVEGRKPRKFNNDRPGGKRKKSEGVVDGNSNTVAFPKRKKAWKKQKFEKMRNATS
ncbi:hypothetical protein LguiA_024576 [Lonicera macranthoides]